MNALERACRLTLLFHSGRAWSELEPDWKELNGPWPVTTRALCDEVRAALKQNESDADQRIEAILSERNARAAANGQSS